MEQTMPDTIEEQSLIRIAYTTTEAAAKHGVNPATIYRLIARRQLRAVPGLRVKRILHSELERFAGGFAALLSCVSVWVAVKSLRTGSVGDARGEEQSQRTQRTQSFAEKNEGFVTV